MAIRATSFLSSTSYPPFVAEQQPKHSYHEEEEASYVDRNEIIGMDDTRRTLSVSGYIMRNIMSSQLIRHYQKLMRIYLAETTLYHSGNNVVSCKKVRQDPDLR
jgi:hypothetical protein